MKTVCRLGLPILLASLVVAAFAGTFGFGTISLDDTDYICGAVAHGFSLKGFAYAFGGVHYNTWMPLTFVTYMLDWTLGWGYGGMHLQSALWQALNAVLLYALLVRLFRHRSAAFLASLVWAIHPLRVESVVWIASRKDVVSTCFFLLALNCWTGRTWRHWAAALALVLVGMTAKPSVMLFPLFAFAIDWCVTRERKRAEWYWGAAFLGAAIALCASWLQGHGATAIIGQVPLGYKLLNALAAMTLYAGNVLCPTDLAVQCAIKYPALPRFSAFGTAVLGASGLWLAFRLARRRFDAVFCGIALFAVGMGPFLGIAGFGYHSHADRFTILPALGLSLALAPLAARKTGGLLVLAFSAFLLFATVRQGAFWRDDKTLFSHTLAVDGADSFFANTILAAYYYNEEHDNAEMIYRHYDQAYRSAWNDPLKDFVYLVGPIFAEAGYASGHRRETDEFAYAMRKWAYRVAPNSKLLEYEFVDALQTLHWEGKSRDARLREAAQVLDWMRRQRPGHHLTNRLAYILARERDDAGEAAALLETMSEETEFDVRGNRRWARKKLGKAEDPLGDRVEIQRELIAPR